MPSYYEPFGLVALEAMACGRPVVASRTGGLLEIIEEGVQGYLVTVGDYLQLARQLTGLVLDSERRKKMGALARERALRFSWDGAASQTISLYDHLINKPVSPNPIRTILEVSQDLRDGPLGDLEPLVRGLLGLE